MNMEEHENDFIDFTESGNYETSSHLNELFMSDLGDHNIESPNYDLLDVQMRGSGNAAKMNDKGNHNTENSPSSVYDQVKCEPLNKLKDSTTKLLCLLEGIKKTFPKSLVFSDPYQTLSTDLTKPLPTSNNLPAEIDAISSKAQQEVIVVNVDDDEEDDCSVYKRLTRKCHCLNRLEYNDFIIHFNESTKYFTSTLGEIIKNMRILKKFIYMGGDYARHALMFLNEGFAYSTHTEKVEIAQGCAHADICDVFDDPSIVIVSITWTCENESYVGDPSTQALTAAFLYKLVQLEEGRRYLKFSSKITSDLKKIIRKNSTKLEFETLELLNSTINILNPPMAQNTNVTYYCKPVDKGFGSKTVTALLHRQYMTLEEVFTHLDLLHNLSNSDSGRKELNTFLPKLLNLFTHMLMEYDNSEMNIIITNILNNVITRTMVKPLEFPRTVVMADTATESIQMTDESNQIPLKRNLIKGNKSNVLVLGLPSYKFKQQSKEKVSGWGPAMNKTKINKDPNCSIIVVPIEE